MEVGLGQGNFVLDGDPAPPKGAQPPSNFQPVVYCGQTAGWIKIPLGTEVGLGPGDIVRWGPSSPPKKGTVPPIFSPCPCGQTAGSIKMALGTEVGPGQATLC